MGRPLLSSGSCILTRPLEAAGSLHSTIHAGRVSEHIQQYDILDINHELWEASWEFFGGTKTPFASTTLFRFMEGRHGDPKRSHDCPLCLSFLPGARKDALAVTPVINLQHSRASRPIMREPPAVQVVESRVSTVLRQKTAAETRIICATSFSRVSRFAFSFFFGCRASAAISAHLQSGNLDLESGLF